MKVKVLRHGNCFDGFSSAAVFTRFYREQIDGKAEFIQRAMRHGGPEPVNTSVFDGDVNAIVDFRYSPSPKLDWWFDHHLSAFVNAEERAHYDANPHPRHYWDPKAPSCAGYMARTVQKEFGFDIEPLEDLIRWVDIIDAAKFPDAHTAVALEEPALQLMSVCEHLQDGPLAQRVIDGLCEGDVDGTAAIPQIQEKFAPIRERQRYTLDLVGQIAEVHDDVVFVDLTGRNNVVGNKFGPYYLYPDATYVVVVNSFRDRVKLSVGCNPWRPEARRHDISGICEKYGGGGHSVVGGITIVKGTSTRAIEIGREIVATLLS